MLKPLAVCGYVFSKYVWKVLFLKYKQNYGILKYMADRGWLDVWVGRWVDGCFKCFLCTLLVREEFLPQSYGDGQTHAIPH